MHQREISNPKRRLRIQDSIPFYKGRGGGWPVEASGESDFLRKEEWALEEEVGGGIVCDRVCLSVGSTFSG